MADNDEIVKGLAEVKNAVEYLEIRLDKIIALQEAMNEALASILTNVKRIAP